VIARRGVEGSEWQYQAVSRDQEDRQPDCHPALAESTATLPITKDTIHLHESSRITQHNHRTVMAGTSNILIVLSTAMRQFCDAVRELGHALSAAPGGQPRDGRRGRCTGNATARGVATTTKQ
jgi:hypothetical protein